MFDRLSQITLALAKKGGGGGGSTNYNDLDHKPKINNVELAGSLSLSDLDVQEELTAGTGINITGSTISVDADPAPTKNSQKPVTSGGTKTAIEASQNASLQMLEDTVGWTGKNFINYENLVDKTSSAHELTSTGIRSYTTSNGTYRGSYIYLPQYPKNKALKLSCDITVTSGQAFMGIFASNDGSDYTTQVAAITSTTTDTSVNLDVPSSNYKYYRININCTMATSGAGDATFSNLMLRLASVSDSTFESYHESVENVLQDAEVTPSKNKFPLKLSELKSINNSGTWNGKTYTHSSGTVTYAITTLDDDETVTNIRMNGTAPSGNLAFRLTQTANLGFGGLKLCGIKGGSSSSYRYYVYDETSTQSVYVNDDSNPVIIPTTYTNYRIMIQLVQGYTASNVDFQPMLVNAGEDDLSFHYYYEPLKDRIDEITDELTTVTSACTNLVSGSTADTNVIKKCGNTVFLNLDLSAVTATGWDTVVAVLPSAYRPSNNIIIWAFIDSAASIAQIYSNGNIRVGKTISNTSIRLSATWVI